MPAVPFLPGKITTVNIDVSGASQRVKIKDGPHPCAVRIVNDGSATAWIEFGDSGVIATLATGVPVKAGVTEVLTASINSATADGVYVAAIAAGSTGKIYFTRGDGI